MLGTPCRKRTNAVMPKAENFGDLITADHKALSEESESRNNHRCAVVVQDLATQWKQSHPCKTKSFQETQKSLMKFLEPTRKPEVIYTANSLEFGKSGEEIILESLFGTWKGLSPHMAVIRRLSLPNMHFQCCMLLQGTLGGNSDIFAASGESTAWVFLWKTRSRPIGVRVCPVAQLNFFSTAFDPRVWTMVVLWKEESGRQS